VVPGDKVRLTADWMGFGRGTEGAVRGFSQRDGKTFVAVTFENGLTMDVVQQIVEVVPNDPDSRDIAKLS
jgi:hypothetical protein